MTSKLNLTVSLVIVGILSFIGCQRQEQPAQNVALRLAWVPDMAESGVFVAREKGHFAAHGLRVEIHPGGFGLDPFKLVAAGSDQFGVGGAGNLLLARERGVPVVAIAAEFQSTPVGFITRRDSGIVSFPQFRGKRVGIQTGADTDVLYRALLAKHQMTKADVVEVPIQYEMTPFVSGQIDILPGYVTNQPITLRANGVEVNVITASSQGLTYYGNVFFTSEDMIRQNPDTVRRFVAALADGWQQALSNKADAISSLQAFTKDFKVNELELIYDAVMPFVRPDGNAPVLGMERSRWDSTYQVLKGAGLSSNPMPTDKAYTTEFLPSPK